MVSLQAWSRLTKCRITLGESNTVGQVLEVG